jgi:hypothetical protein
VVTGTSYSAWDSCWNTEYVGTATSTITSSSTATDSYTWHVWNEQYVTSTACDSTGMTGTVCDSTVSTDSCGTASDSVTWVAWTGEYEERKELSKKQKRKLLRKRAHAEALRKAEEAERKARALEVKRKREEAEKNAQDLLELLIGEEQLKVYKETGRVFIKGKDADYQIVRGHGYNIRKIEKETVRDFCVHLRNKSSMPETDNVVALLLNLQANEKAVMELANDHGQSADDYHSLPRAAIAGEH